MDTPTILVVNPNTSQPMTAAIDRVAQAAAESSANVVTIRSNNGPHTIEGALDAALATAGMLEVVAGHKDPFDALVVACFSDPGVEALRVLVRVPVIGIGAASFMQAASLSQHFAIITPVAGTPERYAAVTAAMGLDRQFVGTYPTPLSVADFESDDPAMLETLVFHAAQAVKDGADCLLFGCAGIADQVRSIEARVGVLCVASAAAGVSQAIACLRHRRAPMVGGPFRPIKTKPLEGFEALQRHYRGR
ncbi:MAG TPA: aspartate/glutamate racemase family protein [Candidatus Tectomicrobia bacterium]|nr:aspartate/glutamate racemase family protein [Candidatus Tectomicrobia bacterium]